MNLLSLALAILLSVTSFSQSQQAKLPLPVEDQRMDALLANRQPAAIRIKVINSSKDPAGIPVRYSIVHPGAETQESDLMKLDKKAEAVITLSENLPYQQVWLEVDELFYGGLLVNSNLEIEIDASMIQEEVMAAGKGVSLSGTDAGLNEQLARNVLYKREERSVLSSLMTSISINSANRRIGIEEFLQRVDSVYTAMKKYDDDFLKENPGFEWAIENETDSDFYEWLIVGFTNKKIPADRLKKIQDHQPRFISNAGVGFYRSLSNYFASADQEKSMLLQKELYQNRAALTQEQNMILDSLAWYETSDNVRNADNIRRLRARSARLMKPALDQIFLKQSLSSIEQNTRGTRADILKIILTERWKDQFASVYPALIHSVNTPWVKALLQASFNKAVANQKQADDLFRSAGTSSASANYYIGNPIADLPFGAQLYTLDSIGKTKDFLLNLRARFANKVLLLDIWATWCAPCIGDIPEGIKLHKENSDLPIEYIYLCTDSGSDLETWKRRIATMKPPGTHIFINDDLLLELRKTLHAEGGYPTYVVIDRDGKVNPNIISFMSSMNREKLKEAAGIE